MKYHNNKSGNSRKNWDFFSGIDSFMAKKPEVNAIATCSSSSRMKINETADCSNAESSLNISDSYVSCFSQKCKRESAQFIAEKRHKENLERKDKIIDLMQKMIDKM